jgi:hypothetical protein
LLSLIVVAVVEVLDAPRKGMAWEAVATGEVGVAGAVALPALSRGMPSVAVATGVRLWVMTAKEKLLERVTKLSEAEAGETLRLLDAQEDPVVVAFREAPEDDEPWTDEDEAAVAGGRADVAAGRTVSLDEAMQEVD